MTEPKDKRAAGAGGLLDAMLDDHAEGITIDDREIESTGLTDDAPDAPRRGAEPQVERVPRRWAADPDAHVGGLRVTGQFELHNGGPEIDGLWQVIKLVSAHPGAHDAGQPHRADTLVAARPAGGPPFVRLTAEELAEEIEAGNLVVIRADERG